MRLVTASLIGLLVASPVLAQEPVTRERQHVVRKGDTLWDLAGFYFSNPFEWRVIYRANTSVVEDPHWIYPDEVLVIPGLTESVTQAPEEARPVRPVVPVRSRRPLRTVFYREEPEAASQGQEPTVLSEPSLDTAPVKPGEFHSAEFLANPEALPVLGLMIGSAREARGAMLSVHPQDEVFVGYAARTRPEVGQRLLVVAEGRELDDVGDEVRVMRPTGMLEVLSLDEDVLTARVVGQYGAIDRDQAVIPVEMFPDFRVSRAEALETPDLPGRLLGFVDVQPLYGRADRGFIDRGRQDGVKVGDIFIAYLPTRASRERSREDGMRYIEKVPPKTVAELRVVRVTDTTATVKVDRLLLPRLGPGLPVQRIRRIP